MFVAIGLALLAWVALLIAFRKHSFTELGERADRLDAEDEQVPSTSSDPAPPREG